MLVFLFVELLLSKSFLSFQTKFHALVCAKTPILFTHFIVTIFLLLIWGRSTQQQSTMGLGAPNKVLPPWITSRCAHNWSQNWVPGKSHEAGFMQRGWLMRALAKFNNNGGRVSQFEPPFWQMYEEGAWLPQINKIKHGRHWLAGWMNPFSFHMRHVPLPPCALHAALCWPKT